MVSAHTSTTVVQSADAASDAIVAELCHAGTEVDPGLTGPEMVSAHTSTTVVQSADAASDAIVAVLCHAGTEVDPSLTGPDMVSVGLTCKLRAITRSFGANTDWSQSTHAISVQELRAVSVSEVMQVAITPSVCSVCTQTVEEALGSPPTPVFPWTAPTQSSPWDSVFPVTPSITAPLKPAAPIAARVTSAVPLQPQGSEKSDLLDSDGVGTTSTPASTWVAPSLKPPSEWTVSSPRGGVSSFGDEFNPTLPSPTATPMGGAGDLAQGHRVESKASTAEEDQQQVTPHDREVVLDQEDCDFDDCEAGLPDDDGGHTGGGAEGGGGGSARRARQCNVVWITNQIPLQRSRRASSISEIASRTLHVLQQLATPVTTTAGSPHSTEDGPSPSVMEPTRPRVRSRVVSVTRADEGPNSSERSGGSQNASGVAATKSLPAEQQPERTLFIYDEDTL
jgi:hypothetical protein